MDVLSLFPQGHLTLLVAAGFLDLLGATRGEFVISKNFSFPVTSISLASLLAGDAVALVGVLQDEDFCFLLRGLSSVDFSSLFSRRFLERVLMIMMMRGRGYPAGRPGWLYFRPASDLKERRASNCMCAHVSNDDTLIKLTNKC